MDVVATLTEIGGISPTKPLVEVTGRRRLRRAVARGEVVRVGRDRYALPTADKALIAVRTVNGYVSHVSAAAHWGWEIAMPPDLPQVTLPRRRPPGGDVDLLAEIFLRDLQREDVDGWAVNRLQTVLHCASDLPFRDGLSVADSALRHGDLDHETLIRAAGALRGPAAVQARRVAAYADGRAANPFESCLRALAIEAGLDVVPQWEVEIDGVRLHPDLADPVRGVALEADSFTWHGDQEAHARDCVRYNHLTLAGWTVLRFTWTQVMLAPDFVRALLARTLDLSVA